MLPPAGAQARLQEVIHAVKAGETERSGTLLVEVVERLPSGDEAPLLLGCTELPLAWRAAGAPGQAVDCLDALAAACARLLPAVPMSPLRCAAGG